VIVPSPERGKNERNHDIAADTAAFNFKTFAKSRRFPRYALRFLGRRYHHRHSGPREDGIIERQGRSGKDAFLENDAVAIAKIGHHPSAMLGISHGTVEIHGARTMDRIDAGSATELIRWSLMGPHS
jgi:hypothetical protein